MLSYYSAETDRILPVMPSDYHVAEGMRPDIWFRPSQVWEIKGAEFTLSPVHLAAAELLPSGIGQGRGLSLRFPRFMRLREDKGVTESTSAEQIVRMYMKQGQSSHPTVEEEDQEEEEEE